MTAICRLSGDHSSVDLAPNFAFARSLGRSLNQSYERKALRPEGIHRIVDGKVCSTLPSAKSQARYTLNSRPVTKTTTRFTSFPLTERPPAFTSSIVNVFKECESKVGTLTLQKGLTSNAVLSLLRPRLKDLGFQIEAGQMKADKIERPVFFGEGGNPELRYQIDAYHPEWRCGLEVEAGRAWMGNAVYRDLIQALVMVEVDHLVLAVPNGYKYNSNGRPIVSADYQNTVAVAKALYGHTRVRLPYGLTVIGY